ncbi:MAG: DUF1080 domain-containing protein [Akkermansiaceae bacterium]|nr:DUF1080 domain-containing protein [Akkermansiaceae bacterium]
MKALFLIAALLATALTASAEEWQTLFKTGDDLKHWKAAENPESVKLNDEGNLVLNGERAHLFYMGADGEASWKNFEFEIQFKTSENANAGVFFHTTWQEKGWPGKGYEAQINATHKDPRKTGSIYAFKDVAEPGHKDEQWVTMTVKVVDNTATVSVNGEVTNEYTQPEDHKPAKKRFDEGTFALQAHDPGSVVVVRSFKVKRLP